MRTLRRFIVSIFLVFGFSFSAVFAGEIAEVKLSVSPSSTKAGESIDLTVEAIDKDGKVVTDYVGDFFILFYENGESENKDIVDTKMKADDELNEIYKMTSEHQGKRVFENGLSFIKEGKHTIEVIASSNSDTVRGEVSVTVTGEKSVSQEEIEIITPEDGIEIGEDMVSVSGKTKKNHKIIIVLNETKEFPTMSNRDGVFEKQINGLQSGGNTIVANILDGDDKVIGSSQIVKVKVGENTMALKEVLVLPPEVAPETPYEVRVTATPGLKNVSYIINDTRTDMQEVSEGNYYATNTSPSEPQTYSIDVILKDELGRKNDTAGIGVAKLKVKEPAILPAPAEPGDNPKSGKNTYCGDGAIQVLNDEGNEEQCDDGEKNGQEGYCASDCNGQTVEGGNGQSSIGSGTDTGEYNKDNTSAIRDPLKITGLKLVELKTKSILKWDKLENAKSYNVYKKIEGNKLELIENTPANQYEIHIKGDDVRYDFFAVQAVGQDEDGETYEGDLSDAVKVKTGPEVFLLLAIALLLGGGFVLMRKKQA